MRFKNISRWKSIDETAGLLFFAQRMDELLFDFTLDTYKPAALNAPYLCKEALKLLDSIESGHLDSSSLKYVIAELEWSIKNDPISKGMLDKELNYYLLDYDKVKSSEYRLHLEILSRTLDPYEYLQTAFKALSIAVKNIEKKQIDTLARTIVTTLLNNGLSKQFLWNRISEFFFSPDGPDIISNDKIDGFINIIQPKIHKFDVYLKTSSLISTVSESIQAFGLKIIDSYPEEIIELAKGNNLIKKENEIYLKAEKIRAHDPYSARVRAIRRLENLSDLFTLFYHKKQIEYHEQAIVLQTCCKNDMILISPSRGPMEKGVDLTPEKASKELNKLLINFRPNNSSNEKFNRVADLHGICLTSDIPENQLVNLWTSLETLIPSNFDSNKINNIISKMIPILMKSYTTRLIERFTFDLITWDKYRTPKILNRIPNSSGLNIFQKTLNLLSIKDNVTFRNDLYTQLKDFHLLRFRAFQLSEIFSDPKKISAILDTHEQKVSWQIRRIYRSRS
jgi:hypothetical protein